MTVPDSQGKPRSKAQAARYKAKATDRRSLHEVKDEFMGLFPGVSEEQVDGLTRAHMEKRIQDFHRLHRRLDSKAWKKSMGRWEKLNRFNDLGIKQANLSLVAQVVWDYLHRHEFNGVARASVGQIMTDRNISERSTYYAIAELKTKGFLEVVKRGDSRSLCSIYRIFPEPKESATTARGAVVGESATTAPRAATPAPRAVTPAPDDTPTEEQKDSEPSVLRPGRSGPADVRLGDARPILPTWDTNSDGGTIPLCPPSIPENEPEFRAWVIEMAKRGLAKGDAPARVYNKIMDYLVREGIDESHRQLADDSLVRLMGAAS